MTLIGEIIVSTEVILGYATLGLLLAVNWRAGAEGFFHNAIPTLRDARDLAVAGILTNARWPSRIRITAGLVCT